MIIRRTSRAYPLKWRLWDRMPGVARAQKARRDLVSARADNERQLALLLGQPMTKFDATEFPHRLTRKYRSRNAHRLVRGGPRR